MAPDSQPAALEGSQRYFNQLGRFRLRQSLVVEQIKEFPLVIRQLGNVLVDLGPAGQLARVVGAALGVGWPRLRLCPPPMPARQVQELQANVIRRQLKEIAAVASS